MDNIEVQVLKQITHSSAFVEAIIARHEAEVNTLERRIMHLENTLRQVSVALDNLID
jgi:hypothetical protein